MDHHDPAELKAGHLSDHFVGLPKPPKSMRCMLLVKGNAVAVQCATEEMPRQDYILRVITMSWWRRLRSMYRWADTTGHFVSIRASAIDGWCWMPVEDQVPTKDPLREKFEQLVDESLETQKKFRDGINEGESWKNG